MKQEYEGRAGIHRYNDILRGDVHSIVLVVHVACTLCPVEKCYLTEVLGRQEANFPPSLPLV
jgi:hypothetical protein